MSNRILRTSTAMLLALSLMQPTPIAAQVQDEEFPPGAICASGGEPPCADGDELILPSEADPVEVAPAEGSAPAEVVEEPLQAETAPAAGAESPEAAAPEAAAPEAEAAPAEEPAAEAAPAGEVPAEPPPEEAPAAEPESPAIVEPAAEPVMDEPAAEEPPMEAPPIEAPPTEEPAADPVTEAAPEAAPEVIPEAAPEVAPEVTPEVAAPADAPVDAPVDAPAVVPVEIPEGAPDAAATAAEPPPEPGESVDGGLVSEDNAALLEAAQAAAAAIGLSSADPVAGEPAAAVAAAGLDDDAAAPAAAAATREVVLTEGDTRQSSEDFDTTASGALTAAARDGGRSGLSNFEKAALAGLGILAVGAILNNRDRVVVNTGDRVVVRRDENDYFVLKDDDALLRQPGSRVRTETFDDGSTRTIVTRDDGSRIITIRDAAGRVLRRVREDAAGNRVTLIDDTLDYEPVRVGRLPPPAREVRLVGDDPLALRLAIERASAANVGRGFSLRQIREIEQVRKLVPEIMVENVTFATGSAAIDPSQARALLRLGDLMKALIDDNPAELFLIEGHTDATGPAAFNLALSDRRAESLALALTEHFGVPPENMVVQGYGESDLKVDTQEAEVRNRRVAVRRITPLIDQRLARN